MILKFEDFILENLNATKTFLFIGDSLTSYANGWQDYIAKIKGYKVINLSKGGKRTDWMLSTLKTNLKPNTADYVFIYGGINDAFAWTSLDKAFSNIQEMVDYSIQMGAKPIVIIGYNPSKVNFKTGYEESIETKCRNRYIELQAKLKNIKNAKIIPMEDTITTENTSDGIHLNASGFKKFNAWILQNTTDIK